MTVHTAFLAIHVAAGSLGLVLGPVAMLAPKRRGRHTRAGTAYHWNMLVVCLSAVGLAVLAWSQIWWFVPIAVFSYANALVGYLAVRRRRPGWLRRHIGGMGGSYIALVTALLVVNAGVAAWWAWALPSVLGTVLIRRTTLRLNQVSGVHPQKWVGPSQFRVEHPSRGANKSGEVGIEACELPGEAPAQHQVSCVCATSPHSPPSRSPLSP